MNFNDNFATAPERLRGEAEERRALVARKISFGVPFLDDICRGILPHDLILLGAYPGAGKTQLAANIAQIAARAGKRVTFFALEAEPREIERRIKYRCLVNAALADNATDNERLSYADWYHGDCDRVLAPYVDRVDAEVESEYATLTTYYKGKEFTANDLGRLLLVRREHADLVVVDHLHYIDYGEDEGEHRGVKRVVMTLRDSALSMGIPMLVIAHLRKRDRSRPQLMPTLEDFHGTSDIGKIATKAVLLARAADREDSRPHIASTYMRVSKDRIVGATPYTAIVGFDLRTAGYEPGYRLGRIANNAWEPTPWGERPRWAKGAR